MKPSYRSKELIVFDLDGTLAPSKSFMDAEMAGLLNRLLEAKQVAVIGGGGYGQFQKQFLKKLSGSRKNFNRLFLFPTTATSFYRFNRSWKPVYRHFLTATQKKKIFSAIERGLADIGYVHPKKHWGIFIEDRDTQVSYAVLGQKAPIPEKEAWNKTDQRPRMMKAIKKYIPEFEVRSGGLTTIDVTQKGIDKGYGIRQIEKHLHVSRKKMLFIGDRIFPGGNDYAVVKTGIDYYKVENPEDTKKIIRSLLS